jgi:hypothetical protein
MSLALSRASVAGLHDTYTNRSTPSLGNNSTISIAHVESIALFTK